MKHLFKSNVFKHLMGILILLLLIKMLWFAVSAIWLASSGVNHAREAGNKSLYYRVKMTPNEVPAPVKKAILTPVNAGNIKDIRLLAIYSAPDVTVITVEHKGKSKVLGRGEVINGFILEGAGSNYATFSKDGETYRVYLAKSKTSRADSSIRSHNRGSSVINGSSSGKPEGEVTDAGDHVIIDRSLLDHYAKNMDDIYKNIGITEVRKNGQINGFRITFVRRGSPFAKLGVKRGDIIKSLNGQEITSYSAAFNAYKNIGSVENLTLVIQRGKEEMELEYEIN